MRWMAFQPADDQLDMIPISEALALLRRAQPEGLSNPLTEVDLTAFGLSAEGATVNLDFGEGIAATRSMSSTEGQMAFNQLGGMIGPYFPDADLATLTIEGQADPELFGGPDTTAPFAIRQ